MLESIVELLGGLLLSALIVLAGACILGSIVAALRALRLESDSEREEVKEVLGFGAHRVIKTGVIVMTSPENHYGL